MEPTAEIIRATRRAPASGEAVAEAAEILRAGGLVAFPTETVYGLGADAQQDRAVAALYAAKGRPGFNPLIAHVLGLADAERQAKLPAAAQLLAATFWPGPLTLVAPAARTCTISLLARAGLDTVALRAPAHPIARALLASVGRPIVAPSANLSGRVSPTRAEHVAIDLSGRVDFILDGGPSSVGVESTILLCAEGSVALLRHGGLSRSAIEMVLNQPLQVLRGGDTLPMAPGMLSSHYAPQSQLRLNSQEAHDDEAVLDFAGRLSGGALRLDLSASGDLFEAAANLFAHLRELDSKGSGRIAVAEIPETGLGEAINDRLRRAAAPR